MMYEYEYTNWYQYMNGPNIASNIAASATGSR